jgi:hypothetical protein
LDEGFAQGAGGYARDLRNVLGRWPIPPEEISIPIELCYGARDTSTFHSPDLGRTLTARLPFGRLQVMPDEGSSLLWTRSADILTALASTPPGRLPRGHDRLVDRRTGSPARGTTSASCG